MDTRSPSAPVCRVETEYEARWRGAWVSEYESGWSGREMREIRDSAQFQKDQRWAISEHALSRVMESGVDCACRRCPQVTGPLLHMSSPLLYYYQYGPRIVNPANCRQLPRPRHRMPADWFLCLCRSVARV